MVLGQGNQEAANLTREGIEASKAKDWDKAITAFRKAAQLEAHYAPNLGSALQQRATVYVGQKKFQEAIADYSEALKIKSDDPDVYERRAYAEMQLKDYDKALHDYNEAIKHSPEEAKYYQVRALIYQNKGDFKAALADTGAGFIRIRCDTRVGFRSAYSRAKTAPHECPRRTIESSL